MFAVISAFSRIATNLILRIICIHGKIRLKIRIYPIPKKKKKKQRKKRERIKEIKEEERRPVAGRRGSFLEPLNDGRRGSKLPIRAR